MAYYLRVKICGVTNADDARAAALLGADAVGLNFYPLSPRYLYDLSVAADIVAALPPFVEPVAVFVEEPVPRMTEVADAIGRVRTVQWHGKRGRPLDGGPLQLIPAFNVEDEEGLAEVRRHLDQCRAAGKLPPAILLDAHVSGMHGGTGRTAPWDLLADFHPGVPVILAGGLTPDNVAEAVRTVRPYAVDVAGGVETAGRKDVEKMRRFIENARGAFG